MSAQIELLEPTVLLSGTPIAVAQASQTLVEPGPLQQQVSAFVPGTANPWMAYSQPNLAVSVMNGQLSAGQILRFSATGSASHNGGTGTYGPDGWTDEQQTVLNSEWQAALGMSNAYFPCRA